MNKVLHYLKNNEPVRFSGDTYKPNDFDGYYVLVIDHVDKFEYTSYVEKDKRMKLE